MSARFFLMELGHADVLGRYENLDQARRALALSVPFERDDEEFAIVEINDDNWATGGDVIH